MMRLCAIVVALAGGAAAQPVDADAARQRRRTPVVEVFEQARDAVVNISATQVIQVRSFNPFDQLFEDMFQVPPDQRSSRRQITRTSVGSGFVLHPEGYVVTNAHVVSRTAERKVIFADGREYDARVIAADPQRDLAVLKIDVDRPLAAVELGRSGDLMVGETVIAIGNPLGYQHTVTSGVVSAVDRELPVSEEVTFRGLVQTDASINPGNSGGPLLNVLGQLIGVNTAIRADAQNIGFAIPVDQLREVLPQMLAVERRYGLDTGLVVRDGMSGCVVAEVRPDSPAAAAGLAPNDVIHAVQGQSIRSAIDLHIALIGRKPGDAVTLSVGRVGDVTLTLADRPRPDGARLLRQRLGLTALPLEPRMARAMGIPSAAGRALLIDQVDPDGPAQQAGVERGDVMLQIGQHETASLDDVGDLLDAIAPDTALTLDVLRLQARTLYRLRVRLVAR